MRTSPWRTLDWRRLPWRRSSWQRLAIGSVLAWLTIASPAIAAEAGVQGYSPISGESVRGTIMAELRTRGIDDAKLPRAEDIEVPLAVPARAGVGLRVTAACWDADASRVRFRLECREAGACLPFLAYVRMGSHAEAASCQVPRKQASTAGAATPAVHAGERATAVLVAAGIRMTAPVTCMDRGARGEIIRVRGSEGRIFRARVTAPALVEVVGQ